MGKEVSDVRVVVVRESTSYKRRLEGSSTTCGLVSPRRMQTLEFSHSDWPAVHLYQHPPGKRAHTSSPCLNCHPLYR